MMNINLRNNFLDSKITKTCDLKCQFSFNYQVTPIMGKQLGNAIELKPVNQSSASVRMNNKEYRVKKIMFWRPTSFRYNNTIPNGEMRIYHQTDQGKDLVVYIPLMKIASTRPMVMTEMLNEIADKQTKFEFSNLSIKDWTLADFVPSHSPFYFFETEDELGVAFGLSHAITLNNADFDLFSSLCSYDLSTPIPQLTVDDFFVNNKGSNASSTQKVDDGFMACEEYDEEILPYNTGEPSPSAYAASSSSASPTYIRDHNDARTNDKIDFQFLIVFVSIFGALILGYIIINFLKNYGF